VDKVNEVGEMQEADEVDKSNEVEEEFINPSPQPSPKGRGGKRRIRDFIS
jgi:hypothetical protein